MAEPAPACPVRVVHAMSEALHRSAGWAGHTGPMLVAPPPTFLCRSLDRLFDLTTSRAPPLRVSAANRGRADNIPRNAQRGAHEIAAVASRMVMTRAKFRSHQIGRDSRARRRRLSTEKRVGETTT